MGLLCWKFCPARESCGYFCSSMGRVCCCIGSPSGSKDTLSVDPFVDAKDSKLSVRRISRIDSEDSLDACEDLNNSHDIQQVSPPGSDAPGGRKFTKKISLHKRALKSMIKGGGYASTPDLRNEETEGKEEGFKKSKLHLPRYFVSASSSDDIMLEEREDVEKKNKLRNLLKESRRAARAGSKEKQQMPHTLSLPDQALLPHSPSYRGDLDQFQEGNRDPGMRQSYGSLLQIPMTKEDGSDFALSDEDQTATMGSRSGGSGSQEYLLDEESDRFYDSTEWVSASGERERGEGDGSSMSVGSKDNPSLECFGSITLNARLISHKAISVSILSLQGLPCRKGKDSGLCLEVMVVPGGKSVWLPLPQAQGPKVVVNSDLTVKASQTTKGKEEKEMLVRICVWASGRTWKHCSLGNAIATVAEKEQLPTTLGIYQHTQEFQGLGLLEVSLEYTSEDSKAQIVVHIQRAKFSKELISGKSFASLKSVYRHKRDVWCRLSLWSKGRRIEKETTPKIFLPVTYDPTFRTITKFQVNRSLLPFTSLVIKVLLDKGLGLGQIMIGKLILGPHLYLGIAKGDTPPGTLSHWGKALTHSGPVTAWHYLYQ